MPINRIRTADGGINQRDKPWMIAVNEAQELQNIDLDRSGRGKCITKRQGCAKYYSTAPAGATRVRGIYRFLTNAGAASNLMAAKTNIYTFTSSGAASLTFSLTTGKDAYFTAFRNRAIIVNGADAPRYYTGSATGTLEGSPPNAARYVEVYQNRCWMANTSSSPSRLWHSANRSATNWVATMNAGSVDINPDDGDTITAIIAQKRRLLVFKNRAIYALYNKTVDTFFWELLCKGTGCVAPRSIAIKDDNIFFLADDGVYVLSGEVDKPILFSSKIKPIIDAIADKTTCAGVIYDNQYRLLYYVSGSSYNNRELVLNFRTGAWSEYRYQSLGFDSYFYNQTQDILWAGGATNGLVYQLDTGRQDITGKIYTYYKSGAMDFDAPDRNKHFDKTYVCGATASGSLFMDYWVDFVTASDQRSIPMTNSGKKIKASRQQFEGGTEGRYLEIAIADSSNTAGSSLDRQIYSIDTYADILEDD